MKDYDPTIRFRQIISTAYIRVTQKILINKVYESLKFFCEFLCCKKLFRASHWRQSKVLLCVLYYCVSLSLRKRHTVFVDSVEHSLSVWDSVKGTKKCFCFLLDPEKEGVWYRRYSCFSCSKCKELEFLDCTNIEVCRQVGLQKVRDSIFHSV